MAKPEHRWQTRQHLAYVAADEGEGAAGSATTTDGPSERFVLRFVDGREGRATLGLERQVVDAVAAGDPDLPHAVRCWLAARGTFRVDLRDEAGASLACGAFTVDDLGDPVAPSAPQRIITLAPSNAEVVDALDAFDRVVACEDSTDHPPEVRALPRLGPDLGPDLDRVQALAPALVVSSLSVPGMERIVTGLRARGVAQVVLAPRSLDDVLEDLRRVGAHLHVPARAEAAVAGMQAEIEALRRNRPSRPVPIYLEWWPRPMFSPGRDTYANALIELAGGVNVFGDRPGASVRIEPEELVSADPALCFVSWCGVPEAKLDPARLRDRPGLEALAAARAGRVYPLDERFSGRPGPRMLEASRRMAAAIRDSGVLH